MIEVRPSAQAGRKSGIALVIVLGFLALLTILVVAFAITMRTERVASRNYQDSVKAKQLIRVGLARAQAQLDADLGGPPPAAPKFFFPPWPGSVLASVNTGSVINTTYTDPLLSGDATNFIPLQELNQAVLAANGAGWNPVVINDQNNNPALIGRTAYVIVDCSGLLDANNVSGLPRGPGIAPGEIVISNSVVSELIDGPPSLALNRSNTYVRFESLPDLKISAKAGGNLPPNSGSGPANLFVYSRSPRGAWNPGASAVRSPEPVYLGGASPDLVAAQNAFASMGFSDPVALVDNLTDYIDNDDRPKNANSFCTEAVPMINEIVISNSSVLVGSTNVFTFTPTVELSFPFVGRTNALSYHLTLGIVFSGATIAGYNPSNLPASLAYPNSGLYAGTAVFAGPWTPGRFATVPMTALPSAKSSGAGAVPAGCFANMKAKVTALLRETSAGGTLVDEVRDLVITNSYVSSTVPSTAAGGAACNDPRFNHLVSNTQEWRAVDSCVGSAGPNTLGRENAGVVTYANPGCDGTNFMYVRNGPLTNTGELGFLAYDSLALWKTIRLLNNGTNTAHPVLDYFTATSNAVVRGLVNPNTRKTPVLAAALVGAWTNFYPFGPGGLSSVDANNIASLIMANGPFTNRSDLGRIDIHAGGWPVGLADYQREAIIRNTADLLSVRQNVFTVIVAAQAIRREPGKAYDATVDDTTEVVAEQRAVAVVWRDPYAVTNSHEQIVTFFKWLAE